MASTLVAHRGAMRVSKEHRGRLPDPVGSTTVRPVRPIDLVNALGRHLDDRGLIICREEYAKQTAGAWLFGLIDSARKESDGLDKAGCSWAILWGVAILAAARYELTLAAVAYTPW